MTFWGLWKSSWKQTRGSGWNLLSSQQEEIFTHLCLISFVFVTQLKLHICCSLSCFSCLVSSSNMLYWSHFLWSFSNLGSNFSFLKKKNFADNGEAADGNLRLQIHPTSAWWALGHNSIKFYLWRKCFHALNSEHLIKNKRLGQNFKVALPLPHKNGTVHQSPVTSL